MIGTQFSKDAADLSERRRQWGRWKSVLAVN